MKKLRIFLTIIITKVIIVLLRIMKKGGTNMPGKVAQRLCPDILSHVSENYKTIFVTGTNGKTTTTKMIVNMLKENNIEVISNEAGANMKTGIITCFVQNYRFKKKDRFAIIEIDEANLKYVSKEVKGAYLVITNIFRDQLDRYGEVYTTLRKILEGVNDKDMTLILNGDEPLFGDIEKDNKRVFFGLNIEKDNQVDINVEGKFCIKCGKPYEYNFVSYSHIGDYYCECGYKRPEITYFVDRVVHNSDGSTEFSYKNKNVKINMSGLYNVYNALAAISVSEMLGLNLDSVINSLSKEKSPFGRQEEVSIYGKNIKLMLVKNPAGFNEALNILTTVNKDVTTCFMLNDNAADGKDVSWIFDTSIEKVTSLIKYTYCGGNRAYDMAIRLNIGGVDKEKIKVVTSYPIFLEQLSKCEDDTIYTFVTYTAMMEFRKFLFDKKFISKLY